MDVLFHSLTSFVSIVNNRQLAMECTQWSQKELRRGVVLISIHEFRAFYIFSIYTTIAGLSKARTSLQSCSQMLARNIVLTRLTPHTHRVNAISSGTVVPPK